MPRFVVGMVAVVALAEGAYLGGRYLLTPWARSHDGLPPLVGYWHGEMAIAPGDTRQIALHLRVFETAREFLLRGGRTSWDSSPTPDIRVMAKTCGPGGSSRYAGYGDVADRHGSRFTFGLTAESETVGQHPSNGEGIWDGKDQLELTVRAYTRGADGTATAQSSLSARPGGADDTGTIRFEARRIDEAAFDAVCAR